MAQPTTTTTSLSVMQYAQHKCEDADASVLQTMLRMLHLLALPLMPTMCIPGIIQTTPCGATSKLLKNIESRACHIVTASLMRRCHAVAAMPSFSQPGTGLAMHRVQPRQREPAMQPVLPNPGSRPARAHPSGMVSSILDSNLPPREARQQRHATIAEQQHCRGGLPSQQALIP